MVAEVDGRKTDVSKEKGRVCACEKQKKPGGFYKSVKSLKNEYTTTKQMKAISQWVNIRPVYVYYICLQ